jgi:hypothetical protein
MNTPIKTIEAFYKAVKDGDAQAKFVLELQNRYNGLFDFDPVSFENVPSTLDDMLLKYLAGANGGDRLYRIFLYAKDSLKFLMHELHTKILREHIIMSVRQVRETDGKTIRWLSKKPGRNVKEKLSGSYKLLAVRRLQSFDTAENRLLKAFAVKLDDLLFLRETCVQIPQAELDETLFLARWLRSEDADYIGEWKNTPPNNTLLSDKHYKKLWIAWNALQHLDEDTAEDFLRFDYIRMSMTIVHFISKLSALEPCRFIQQPVRSIGYFTFDFALQKVIGRYGADTVRIIFPHKQPDFTSDCRTELLWNKKNGYLQKPFLAHIDSMQSIESHTEKLLQYYKITDRTQKNVHNPFIKTENPKRSDICVINFSGIKPFAAYSSGSADSQTPIPFYLLQQFWVQPEHKHTVPVSCGYAQAIILKSSTDTIKTFSIHSILHTEDNDKSDGPLVKEAAGAFVKALAAYLPCETCIYLIPDSIDEFSSEIIRMNMNLYFHASQNIPRSIAQLFTVLDTIQQPDIKAGDYILIIDRSDRETVYTPIQAALDRTGQLINVVPETNGIIWERHPPITKVHKQYAATEEKISECLYAAQSLFCSEDVTDAPHLVESENTAFVAPADVYTFGIDNNSAQTVLPHELQKHHYAFILEIDNNEALCSGGIQFAKFQAMLDKNHCPIPLWKDHLPNLTLKSINDTINLVDEKTDAVIPKRGASIPIPVRTQFEIPAGAAFCEFELIRGDSKQKEQFFAYLANNRFPLEHSVRCRLNLQYTYGADNPYALFFIPTDKTDRVQLGSFKAEWKKERQLLDLSSLPIPQYIKIYTLKDFMSFQGKDGKVHNLFEWLNSDFKKIKDIRRYGWWQDTIYRESRDGNIKFFDAKHLNVNNLVDGCPVDVFCYKEKFVNDFHFRNAHKRTRISCYLIQNEKGKYIAQDITVNNEAPNKCFLRKSIRFPLFTVCRDGFSFFTLGDKFQAGIGGIIQSAEEIIETDSMPQAMKDEMRLFLSVLHKDTPQSNIDFLEECLKDSALLIQNEYWRNIAFVLGDCSCSWQNRFLEEILQRITDQNADDICLQILAVACWRSQDFVFQLTTEHLQSILRSLDKNLKDSIENIKDMRMHTMVLEEIPKRSLSQEKRILSHYLELILALLRLRNNPDYRELLSPLSPQVEKIIKHLHTLKKEKLALTSRIEFDVSDSKIDKEDLTLIVEMYVQGDEKTKAIKIIGITEAEE